MPSRGCVWIHPWERRTVQGMDGEESGKIVRSGPNNGKHVKSLRRQSLGQILSAWPSSEKGWAVGVRETIGSQEIGNPTTWVWVFATLLSSCVLFSEQLNIAESHFICKLERVLATYQGLCQVRRRDRARKKVSGITKSYVDHSCGSFYKWVTVASILLYFLKCISLDK